MIRTKFYFVILVVLCNTLSTFAQRDLLTFRKTLELFKEHGAVVYTPDSEFVDMLKAEITFGKIYGENDSMPDTFEGLYIVEYIENNIPIFGSSPTFLDGFFLGVDDGYTPPTSQATKIRDTDLRVALRISNEMREKWPIYCAILNGLIELTYEQDKDISVVPVDRENAINHALGNKVSTIKNKELLMAQYELHRFLQKETSVERVYPYPFKIVDLYGLIESFKNHEKGKAIFISTMLPSTSGKYVIDCETHELLYGKTYSRQYIEAGDMELLKLAIDNAK